MKKASTVTRDEIIPQVVAWLRLCRLSAAEAEHVRAYQIAAARLEQGEEVAALNCLRELKARYESMLRNIEMSKTERQQIASKLRKVSVYLNVMESK